MNWICAALKVTVRYIDCVLYINQTTKDKDKITLCSSQKDFSSFKKQRKFNSYSEDYAVLFYIWLFNFYSRLITEYFRLAFIIITFFLLYGPLIIMLNNRDYNIYQNNRDCDFCQSSSLNFQCHMILQKSLQYADLMLRKHFRLLSVLLHIFVELWYIFFRILWLIKKHLFEIKIFWNIIKIFKVTFKCIYRHKWMYPCWLMKTFFYCPLIPEITH